MKTFVKLLDLIRPKREPDDDPPLTEAESIEKFRRACGPCWTKDPDGCCMIIGLRNAGWMVDHSEKDGEISFLARKPR